MEDEKKWSEIDDYLMDRLDATQRKDFEKKLEQDKALQDSLQLERELIEGMKAYEGKQQFLKILQQSEEETPIRKLNADHQPEQTKGIRRWLRPAIGVAASITILVLTVLFWPSSVNPSQLADNHYLRSEDKLSPQLEANGLAGGVTDSQLTDLRQAIEAFEKRELTTAEDLFEGFKGQAAQQTYTSILVDFYLAQIAWERSNYDESLEILQRLSQLDNLPISNEINYYLGLNYLKQENLESAQASLEKVSANHKWHEKAAAILQKLP